MFTSACSLDPRLYTDTDTGEVYSGALLMNAGVNLTQAVFLDGQSVVKHFIANKAHRALKIRPPGSPEQSGSCRAVFSFFSPLHFQLSVTCLCPLNFMRICGLQIPIQTEAN